MSSVLKAGLLCGVLVIASHGTFAQEADSSEDAASVAVPDAVYHGTGCKTDGSVEVKRFLNSDGLTDRLRVNFADYKVEKGYEFCAIRLSVVQQGGWQFAIDRARFEGNARLPAGAFARALSIYGFGPKRATFQTTVPGPKATPYYNTAGLDDKDLVWSKCGAGSAFLGFNTVLGLRGSVTPATWASLKSNVYWLKWRRCQ